MYMDGRLNNPWILEKKSGELAESNLSNGRCLGAKMKALRKARANRREGDTHTEFEGPKLRCLVYWTLNLVLFVSEGVERNRLMAHFRKFKLATTPMGEVWVLIVESKIPRSKWTVFSIPTYFDSLYVIWSYLGIRHILRNIEGRVLGGQPYMTK